MTTKRRERERPPSLAPSRGDTTSSGLDYESALQALLSDVGMSDKEVDDVLDSIEASRAPGNNHLSFDEASAYNSLSVERQQHVDACKFCGGMVQCFLSSEQMTELARDAARAADPRTQAPFRITSPVPLAAAFLVVLSLFSAFVVGRSSSEPAVPKEAMARYIEELGLLGAQDGDAGAKFRAARLYSDLDLKPQAQKEFLVALEQQNVRQDEIARFLALSREATEAGAFNRLVARLRVTFLRRCDATTSPEACLSRSELELKAGDSTAAYKSFLRYLSLIDERPAGSERYDDTLAASYLPMNHAGGQ